MNFEELGCLIIPINILLSELTYQLSSSEKTRVKAFFFQRNQKHICFDAVVRIPFLLCSVMCALYAERTTFQCLLGIADDHRYLMDEKERAQSKLSQASFLFLLLYDTTMPPTKHKKNYLLFGSGSSNMYSFDFSMPEKSSDQLCYQTQKKKKHFLHTVRLLMVLKYLGMLLQ